MEAITMYKLLYSPRSASMVIHPLSIVLQQEVAQFLPDFAANQQKSVENLCSAGRGVPRVLSRLATPVWNRPSPRRLYQRPLLTESSEIK